MFKKKAYNSILMNLISIIVIILGCIQVFLHKEVYPDMNILKISYSKNTSYLAHLTYNFRLILKSVKLYMAFNDRIN